MGVFPYLSSTSFGSFDEYTIPKGNNWRNNFAVGDINGDRDADIVNADMGLNIRYHVSAKAAPIATEDFESQFPKTGWRNLGGWGVSNCQVAEGYKSGWPIRQKMGSGCTRPYPNDSFSWLIYGPFSLKDAKKARINYMLWLNAQKPNDFIFVGASVNGSRFYGTAYTGTSGTSLAATTELDTNTNVLPNLNFVALPPSEVSNSSQVSWVPMKFDLQKVPTLGDLTGKHQVWIGFLWASDEKGGLVGGAFVDDIILSKTIRRR